MASDDHDDDSSVESDFEDDDQNGGGIVITMDDMSVASQDFPRGKFSSRSGSFVSVLSTESSIEADLAPPAPQRQGGGSHNATWNNDSKGSNPSGRYITVSSVPDSVPQAGKSRGKGLRRSDGSSGSCGSIKEHLHFGAINEDTAYDSLGSSDEESGDESHEPTNLRDMQAFRKQMLMKDDYGDESSEAESSVDDSVIKNILSKTDSRERIIGTGTRSSRTKHRPTTSARKHRPEKAKGATGDPLLNRFLDARHKGSSSGNRKDPMADSLMGKTDSLNHVNKQGQRIVKTKKDVRSGRETSSRRSSVGAKDPLMERFLATKATQRQNNDVSKAGMNVTLNSCDSLQRVDGKGQRLVGTRLGC
jgi:hypothetical protein